MGYINTTASRIRDTSQSVGSKLRSLGAIVNPIENELRSLDSLYFETFQSLPIVPPFGRNLQPSYATMLWLIDLERISPTHSACIEAKQRMCFDALIDVVKAPDTQFYRPELKDAKEISAAERDAYIDAVQDVYMPYSDHLKGLATKVYRNWETSGNAYVLMKIYREAGVVKTKLECIDSQHCLYMKQDAGRQAEVQQIVVSDSFLYGDLVNMYESVEVYPVSTFDNGKANLNLKELEDGTQCTIFHLKNNRVGRFFYGEPLWLASMRHMYAEFQDITYKTKEQERGYAGLLILEVNGDYELQDEDLENSAYNTEYNGEVDVRNVPYDYMGDSIDSRQRVVDEVFRGDGARAATIAMLTRGPDDKPMTTFHIPANTNHEFYKQLNEIQEEKILQAHGISKAFLGGEAAAQGLGGEAFVDEFKVRNITTFEPIQQLIGSFLNRCIDACFVEMGNEAMTEYSIKFRSKYQMYIDKLKEEEDADATNS